MMEMIHKITVLEDLKKNPNARWQDGINDLATFVGGLSVIEELKELASAVIWDAVYPWLYHQYGDDRVGTLQDIDDAESGKMIQDLISFERIVNMFASVDEFLAFVDKAKTVAEDAKNKESWSKYVIISTIHRLKGLEREKVFILHLSEGYKIEKSGEERPIGMLPYTYAMSSPPPKKLYSPGGSRMEDERCIAYVAMSRAKSKLHISSVRTHPFLGGEMSFSRFVREAQIGDA